jgi:hypothetical protein
METDLTKLLLSEWSALLMAAVWIISALAERAFPHYFEKGRWGNRLEPVFPVVICTVCAVFVPGPWIPAEMLNAQKVVLGVILGAGAYNFAGLAKRVGLTPFLTGLTTKKSPEVVTQEAEPAQVPADKDMDSVPQPDGSAD